MKWPAEIYDVERKILEMWSEITMEAGIKYVVKEVNGICIAIPESEYDAMLKQFGSGIDNIPAEFWIEKAKKKLYERIKNEW